MSARICPICSRPAIEPAYRPFCSSRCANVDLQRWFSGAYVVPSAETDAPSAEEGPEAGRARGDPL